MSPTYSVVIPNYNGVGVIERCLDALRWCPDVTVVDDASVDGSREAIHGSFPYVRLIERVSNSGFAATVNEGIRATDGDLVVVVNSDAIAGSESLDLLLPLFADENVFAVGPRVILPSLGGVDEGYAVPAWHHGLLYGAQGSGAKDVTPILYTTGCAAVYRRSMLEALGGFDEAYSPFYWEDVDLGYRAWKRGWKSLYQPASAVEHGHASTISKLDARYVKSIMARNGLLFIWRNIEDGGLLRQHRLWLPLVVARRAAALDGSFLGGWAMAWCARGEAAAARNRDSAFRRLSDREIFEAVGVKCPRAGGN